MSPRGLATSVLLLLASLLCGCASLPAISPGTSYRVDGIPGPEDLVWDAAFERLLVSSTDRRLREAEGQIVAVDPRTLRAEPLPRHGEPDGLAFNPHGLSHVQTPDGPRLYVISHGRAEGGAPHTIAVYAVEQEQLRFLERLDDPLLTSPNDLAALPDGSLYVGNDRRVSGSLREIIFGLKQATIVHYRPGQGWRVVAEGLGFPNGIVVDDDRLIAAASREHRLYAWDRAEDGSLSGRRLLARVRGPDNLERAGDRILVAGHLSDLAFLRHVRLGTPAPTVVHSVDPQTGSTEAIFVDDGRRIPAGSVAVPVGSTLWIGQVFDPWILAFEPPPSE